MLQFDSCRSQCTPSCGLRGSHLWPHVAVGVAGEGCLEGRAQTGPAGEDRTRPHSPGQGGYRQCGERGEGALIAGSDRSASWLAQTAASGFPSVILRAGLVFVTT